MADTWLKQSTSVTVVIGPIWSTTNGALKADLAYNASGINCDIYKNGTKADVTLANSAGDGYFRAGSGEALYLLTLSTGHTDTLGRLEIALSATGYYMKPRSYMVVPANVWDSMFGADYLKTEVVEISGDSTAADNLEADYDGTGYAKTASTTKLHADYDAAKTAASQSSVNTVAGYIDTEVAAILAAVDTEVAAIKAKTDNLPANTATVLGTPAGASLAADIAAVKAETASILTDTGTTLDTLIRDIPTNSELATALASADDAVLAAIAGLNDLDAAGIRTAVGMASANLDAQLAALPTATENADALLNRDMSAVSDTTARSPLNALRALRNKSSINEAGDTYTVTKEDDETTAWEAAVTSSENANPISGIDPT